MSSLPPGSDRAARTPISASDETGWLAGPLLLECTEAQPRRWADPAGDFLLVRLGDHVAAFHNRCPHQQLPLDTAEIDPATGILRCPWHGWEFDARTGAGISLPACPLESVALRIDDGRVWLQPG